MEVASDNFQDYPNFKETYFIDDSTPEKARFLKILILQIH
ncbi:MAG: hypothetical protein CM15mP102_12860 [Flavobacteriales bacterium]|nr:MAG: hypothetical protein CM15mP102_12860 [Flavobacteriales bacterium]